ncbi:non-ribosomal peptide synthetase [Kribbella sp. NPDC051718]|uniref:non-ribosomal peptide synthetase n=1 Tax=Kribbella sp. NPDC051718 TaxID=3155168 RepID=UPI003440B652
MTANVDSTYGEADARPGLPTQGTCSRTSECGTQQRSRTVPVDLDLGLDADVSVLAGLLILVRRYSNQPETRIGIRRGDVSTELVYSAPSGLGLPAHRRAVSDRLEHASATPTALPLPKLFLAVGDGGHVSGTDLTISFQMSSGATVLQADFHHHVHSAAFVDRMLGHLEKLLENGVRRPDTTIAEAQMLSEAELAQWAEINDTARPYPRDANVFELFAEQAAGRPDRVAVHDGEGALTYQQLLEQSRVLAGELHAQGVRQGDRVAFQLPKTARLVVAMLAILRIGAVYVPIDVKVPEARRNYLLADSGAVLLLVDGSTSIPAEVPAFDLAAVRDVGSGAGDLPAAAVVSATQPAYVMYTSGTTGEPKGVVVSQRAVVRLVRESGYVELSSRTVLLQTGAIAFDATTFEFWGPLLNGGSVVLVPDDLILDPAEIGASIVRHQANTLFLTTGLFNQIVENDAAVLNGCTVLFGGEFASARRLADAVQACPDSDFVHVYGPTENTTFSLAYRITKARYPPRVPIGRPIGNSTVWVLDLDGNPQPVDVPGELYVGGDGLASGYLNRPELDAAAFVDRAGDRLYRTGDIAVLNSDGQVEFIGRADEQVKVRGHRIELGEVEHHISRIDGVDRVVVLSRKADDGLTSLCAFFTAGVPLAVSSIRSELLSRLPDYLVPSLFVQVAAIPMTLNSKVDKAALAARWPAPGGDGQPPVADECTPMEAEVAKLFSEVLTAEVTTPDADFFALGGHSLLMMRLHNRIKQKLQLEIGIGQLTEASTVRGVAAVLETAGPVPKQPVKLVRRSHLKS